METKHKKPVELKAYIDFTCYKSRIGRDIVYRTLDKLGNDVDYQYRFIPSPLRQPASDYAAKAALAAKKQGQFQAMYDKLYAHEGSYREEDILEMARDIPLDMDNFERDFRGQSVEEELKSHRDEANKLGLTITPALTIENQPYTGALDEQAILEAIVKRGGRRVEIFIEGFFRWGASAAFVLLIATVLALIFVNAGFQETYEHLKHSLIGFVAGSSTYQLPLEVWVNDAMMSLFFLLIGLEIKKEVLYGELSELSRAAMPIIAAIGGMMVPALLYFIINLGTETSNGWGVPMATDIAFTLGLMALLGSRVPLSLKVFVSALAVADDLGAVVVIALFYGHGFHLDAFTAAIVVTLIMAALNYFRVYAVSFYIVLGIILWYFIFESGIHSTLAGFITAILIPSRRSGNLLGVATQASIIFEQEIAYAQNNPENQGIRYSSLKLLQRAIHRLREPGYYLEHGLERWVNFLILPLFAFFNTGILIAGTQLNIFEPINLGIIVGLCMGKPLGIVGASWIATRLKIARLSSEISWPQMWGAGCLAGVGFTMSIVVASTAFEGDIMNTAKLSILIASALSAIIGLLILSRTNSLLAD